MSIALITFVLAIAFVIAFFRFFVHSTFVLMAGIATFLQWLFRACRLLSLPLFLSLHSSYFFSFILFYSDDQDCHLSTVIVRIMLIALITFFLVSALFLFFFFFNPLLFWSPGLPPFYNDCSDHFDNFQPLPHPSSDQCQYCVSPPQTWNLSKYLHNQIFVCKNFTHWKRVNRDYFRQQ